MKLHRLYPLLAAALTLAACEGGDEIESKGEAVVPQFTAGISVKSGTRAAGQTWNADKIGVIVTAAPNSDMETMYANVPYSTASTSSDVADFTPVNEGIYFQDMSEAVTFAAYAPYQEAVTDSSTITVNDTREANLTAADQETIDFLFASGVTGSAASPKVNFSFTHIMSKLVLKFQLGNSSLTFDDLTGSTTYYTLAGITHSGVIDLNPASTAFGTAKATGSPAGWDITDCVHDDANGVRAYTLYLLPQDLSASGITVLLTINGEFYTSVISPNLQAGYETTYTITVNQAGLSISNVSGSIDWEPDDGDYSGSVEI